MARLWRFGIKMKLRSYALLFGVAAAVESAVWRSFGNFGSFGDLGPTNSVGVVGTIFHGPGMFISDWLKAEGSAETALCIVSGTVEWALLIAFAIWAIRRLRKQKEAS